MIVFVPFCILLRLISNILYIGLRLVLLNNACYLTISILLYIFIGKFLPLVLFLIGILGSVLNRKSIIFHDNILGQIYVTYIIAIAGTKPATGSYLNENNEPKSVLESDRFRLIIDSYNPSGPIVTSAIIGAMWATSNIKGKQVCGIIAPKRGNLATNGIVKCPVYMARIHTIRQAYYLTTDHLPLEIIFGKALVSPDLRFI